MANNAPFDQLVGQALVIYLGPVGEPVPAVNTTPAGNWVRLGKTDGGQKFHYIGDLEYISDDDHRASVLAYRPEDNFEIEATMVQLTLEHWARVTSALANVVSAGGPPATKTMPIVRGGYPTRYAMLLKSNIMSPYGAFPGMGVIPIGVFGGEPELMFSKDERAGLEFTFRALADDTQAANYELGWVVVQTS